MNQHPPAAAQGSAGDDIRRAQELQRLGRLAEAEQLLHRLVERFPGDPGAHRALALFAAQSARQALARHHMALASRLAPASGLLRCELGRLLAGDGRLDEALECFQQAAMLEPALAEAWFFLGITRVRLNRHDEAAPALRQALALDPDQPEILAALAYAEFQTGQVGAALPLWQKLIELRPGDEDIRLKLGETLTRLGRHADARAAFRAALQVLPGSEGLWMALGQAEEDAGDRSSAGQAYDQALALRPGWAFPLAGLLGLHRADVADARLSEADALQQGDTLSDAERALIGYALGKVHDGRGDHARAMAVWCDANAARRREQGPLDRPGFDDTTARITAAFPAGALASAPTGSDDGRPVFVVGMPRSGTTLVEQIIASHPLAAGCGELEDLSLAARAAPRVPVADIGWLKGRAAQYLAAAERHASRPGGARLVDKAPLNFFHLGLAAQLFPNARVIWCRRDARDIGLSIFSENFALDSRFATDLADIALMINTQHRLMRHWQATLPLPVLEVDYEALVTDIEPGIRRIVDFLGLPWDSSCLDFHISARAVQTPSRWQVRRPAHTGSIGRWRDYAAWLAPLTDVLDLPVDADGFIKS